MIGENRLTPTGNFKMEGRKRICEYLCACGNLIWRYDKKVSCNNLKSCGCLNKDMARIRARKHGAKADATVLREYTIWQQMKDRCNNPNSNCYSYYGGRGITVCDEWVNSFETFYSDMGPSNGGTLDRIDNTKGYNVDNCKWATRLEQSRNRDYCIVATYNGKTQHTWEWAAELGIHIETFRIRLRQHKADPQKYTQEYVFSKKYDTTRKRT